MMGQTIGLDTRFKELLVLRVLTGALLELLARGL
jgi:hypothetical protein